MTKIHRNTEAQPAMTSTSKHYMELKRKHMSILVQQNHSNQKHSYLWLLTALRMLSGRNFGLNFWVLTFLPTCLWARAVRPQHWAYSAQSSAVIVIHSNSNSFPLTSSQAADKSHTKQQSRVPGAGFRHNCKTKEEMMSVPRWPGSGCVYLSASRAVSTPRIYLQEKTNTKDLLWLKI